MSVLLSASAVLASTLLATSAQSRPVAKTPSAPEVRQVTSELEPLRTWFNDARGKPRVVVLLSPT